MEGIDPTPEEHAERIYVTWLGRLESTMHQVAQAGFKHRMRLRLPVELFSEWLKRNTMLHKFEEAVPGAEWQWYTPYGAVEIICDDSAADGGELSLVLKRES